MAWGNWNPPGASSARRRASSSTTRSAPARGWSNNTSWAHRNPNVRREVARGNYGAVGRNYISGGRTTGNLSGAEREAWSYYTSPQGLGQSTGTTHNPEGWNAFRSANIDPSGNFIAAPGGGPLDLGGGGGGGGGGWGGGGGGGGGGGAGITQAMIDAMGRVLGAQGPQLALNTTPLPAFQGQALGAFNAQPYQQAAQQVQTARAADLANITANQAATQQALSRAYTNDYANAQVTPGAQTQAAGTALADTAGTGGGGGGAQQAAQQSNAANADSQASFQNLLQVLGAASQQSQASRQAQVGMDANYGRQGVNASTAGLLAGVNTQRAQAANQWGQAQQERAYQNNLMQQQYAMQNAQRQQDLRNQQAQANWQNQTQSRQAALQPILQLIQQGGGQSGLNFNALYRALGIAA